MIDARTSVPSRGLGSVQVTTKPPLRSAATSGALSELLVTPPGTPKWSSTGVPSGVKMLNLMSVSRVLLGNVS
jgi:hypothetical protein